MIVLGISAYFHDSAAALLVDGVVIAAVQEERFTRIKHDSSFPTNAVAYCLEAHGITINEVDAVVYYEKPLVKFGRIIDAHMRNVPKHFWTFRTAIKSWISDKLWVPKNIQKALNYSGQIFFTDHHEAHAASAFFSSPFEESTIVVIDAVGEKACTSICKGKDSKITPIIQQEYPHSLGLFYSAFTYYCGFKVNSGEYKLMGLAPYGKPIYVDLIKEHFIQIKEDGTISLKMKNYNFDAGMKMLSKRGVSLLEKRVRQPESTMETYYMNIAASVQKVLEEAVIKIVKHATTVSNSKNIVLAGGVALNCVANQKLKETFNEHNFWIQPAAGDAGGALGAAQAYYFKNHPKKITVDSPEHHVYLGPAFSSSEIEKTLHQFKANYQVIQRSELHKSAAQQLAEGKIVGWFQGRMEFGPRALGNRSIIASPIPTDMKFRLNMAIKKREGFRPFAPAILEENANEWFKEIVKSKYMLSTFSVRDEVKNRITSCVHEDDTSRVQTVSSSDNKDFYDLIREFNRITGVPILINTSFNLRGEPIVCTPEDAINCFANTEMDVLVLENYVVLKKENPSIKPSRHVKRILD